MFDKNNDGKISSEELGCVLRALGHEHSQKEVEDMIKNADTNGMWYSNMIWYVIWWNMIIYYVLYEYYACTDIMWYDELLLYNIIMLNDI